MPWYETSPSQTAQQRKYCDLLRIPKDDIMFVQKEPHKAGYALFFSLADAILGQSIRAPYRWSMLSYNYGLVYWNSRRERINAYGLETAH